VVRGGAGPAVQHHGGLRRLWRARLRPWSWSPTKWGSPRAPPTG
jgi:hypothetical protein